MVHALCVNDILDSDVLNSVNRCQIAEMEKMGRELDPAQPDSCVQFTEKVRHVEAAIIHTWQLTAFASLRESDPATAAKLWKAMSQFCDNALAVLKAFKDTYPDCGTPQLYDLTLDYKIAADTRYYQSLEDAECAQTPPPKGLFPPTS
jgi:hypothetical protein